MRKIFLIGCGLAFICCAPKQSTVETEGLEEVIVFGEEETSYISEEPVLPQPVEEEVVAPPIEEESTPPPPVEEIAIAPPPPVEEEPVFPPAPVEEEIVAPPPIEEPMMPPPVVEEAPAVVSEQPYVPPVVTPTPPPPSPAPATILGFRIQLFASSTEKNASRVADDTRASFTQNVYIQHIPPYYKVRVGDFLTKEEAQVVKQQAMQMGYRGAFIVETMISP